MVGVDLQADAAFFFRIEAEKRRDAPERFRESYRSAAVEQAVRLNGPAVHGHPGPDEIIPYLKNFDSDMLDQSSPGPFLYVFRLCILKPDFHLNLSFRPFIAILAASEKTIDSRFLKEYLSHRQLKRTLGLFFCFLFLASLPPLFSDPCHLSGIVE